MKKNVLKNVLKAISVILALVLIFGLIVFLGRPRDSYRQELAGETYYVCYETVNVRDNPSTTKGEIVGEKYLHCTVILTGNVVEHPFMEVENYWYETTEGWIVSDALLDEWRYRERFDKLYDSFMY